MNYPALIAEHTQRLGPDKQKEVLDFVLFLETQDEKHTASSDASERERRLGLALEKLVEARPFGDIADPVAWQREIRKDRPLPGRED